MDTIDGRTLGFLIFPYLTSIDAAQLGATCKYFKKLIDAERRFKLHLIYVRHPSEIDYHDLEPCLFNEGAEQLYEYGYTGEGRVLCKDMRHNRYVLFNDLYARGFESDHWLGLVENMKDDKEFDFRWRFIEFPTLNGRERYEVMPHTTVHRGSCIWVSWPIKDLL